MEQDYISDSGKYLVVKTDSELNWTSHEKWNCHKIKPSNCHPLECKRFCQCKNSKINLLCTISTKH